MLAPNTIERRVAEACRDNNLPSAELEVLLADAMSADDEAGQALDAARARALDPATMPDDVAEARQVMEDAQFRRDRIAIAVPRLNAMLTAALASEHAEQRKRERTAAIAERDTLVTELAAEYPALAEKIGSLVSRLAASTARIAACNKAGGGPWLRGAEPIARQAPERWENTHSPAFPSLLSSVRLPKFFKSDNGNEPNIWPPASNH